ncbi:hypothetical protein [Hoyosella altamirensis]|uniref:Uncharacterized protein n=1 Tax=Hoyosella altamirensis TaxID=616997 RepID=A0A839RUG1_9ACTN|nr:hypothetical protein [Hoyosella altamirensis]MBB3039533.1 hypothetical protein [Hoyosella altamirensis]
MDPLHGGRIGQRSLSPIVKEAPQAAVFLSKSPALVALGEVRFQSLNVTGTQW